MPPKDLDDLLYTDALNMWELYQKGMAGPSMHYIAAYNNYALLHNLTQTLVSANSKNYKQKEPEKFESIFAEQFRIMALHDGVERNALSLGTQAAMALEGAPDWINNAIQQEITDGSSTAHRNS